ncbi:MAG: VanW family protein, partial [Phototrophicaceae bacterium]
NGAVPLRNLLNRGRTWLNGTSIAPVIHYDQNAAAERLLAVAAEIDQPARDASLTFDNGTVQTQPGQAGRQVDISATLEPLHELLMTLSAGTELPLVVNETLPLVWNAEAAASRINDALSAPLELVADGPDGQPLGPWTISTDQIASLLSVQLVENADGTRSYEPRIDMSAFEGYLRELAAGLIVLPEDARFRFDTNTSQLIVTKPAQSGRVLDVQRTIDRLQDAVWRTDSRRVPVVFDLQAPRYHDGVTAAELGITELVSESTTIYTGSTPERRHNIAVGAALYDGVIIGPGEEFSFNNILGPVTEEAGFVESGIIQGERTVDGIGGGLCQVSTTVFRAALYGGFTIIERNSHAYRVGFYEINAGPGLDAAIWTPDRDFRFQNDTPHHLLIETSVFPSNNALQFRFYSTNPGRQVEVQDPIVRNLVDELPVRYEVNPDLQTGQSIQVDWAAKGADVTVIRIIRDQNGEEIRRDSIFTHYLPWRSIFQVPPGDPRANSNT